MMPRELERGSLLPRVLPSSMLDGANSAPDTSAIARFKSNTYLPYPSPPCRNPEKPFSATLLGQCGPATPLPVRLLGLLRRHPLSHSTIQCHVPAQEDRGEPWTRRPDGWSRRRARRNPRARCQGQGEVVGPKHHHHLIASNMDSRMKALFAGPCLKTLQHASNTAASLLALGRLHKADCVVDG